MRVKILLLVSIAGGWIKAQNNALILNDAVRIYMNGTSAAKAVITIDQTSTSGIATTGTGTGKIVQINTDGGFNRIVWKAGAGTGNYIIPYGTYVAASATSNAATFTFNASGGTDDIEVGTYETDASNNVTFPTGAASPVTVANMGSVWGGSATETIDRWWMIDSDKSGTVTFGYDGAENTTAAPTTGTFQAQYWGDTDGDATYEWELPLKGTATACASAAAGTLGTVPGVAYTSALKNYAWVLVKSSTPLPVDMVSYDVICNNNYNVVKWSTATETNSSHFVVERSDDGVIFNQLGNVQAAGNSSSLLSYSYTDYSSINDKTTYYRLTQVDLDGKKKLYDTKVSACVNNNGYANSSNSSTVTIYPNPSQAHGGMYAEFKKLDANAEVNVNIFDALGQPVNNARVFADADGYLIVDLDPFGKLASGVYMFVCQLNNGQRIQQKLVVK